MTWRRSIRLGAALAATLGASARAQGPQALPAATYTITLGPRDACVTPETRGQARVDAGSIEVSTPTAATLSATLTGAAAANAYLGHAGEATATLRLVQQVEVACSDPSASTFALTIDSSLIGLVRSRHKGMACARVASASIVPAGCTDCPPIVVSHPPLCVEGTAGRLCNRNLPTLKVPSLPLGKYTLTVDLVLVAEGSGLADGHAAADFSPSAALPSDWVRARDPFQGVEKKNFGLGVTMAVSASGGQGVAAIPPARAPAVVRASAARPAKSMGVTRADAKGYDRVMRR